MIAPYAVSVRGNLVRVHWIRAVVVFECLCSWDRVRRLEKKNFGVSFFPKHSFQLFSFQMWVDLVLKEPSLAYKDTVYVFSLTMLVSSKTTRAFQKNLFTTWKISVPFPSHLSNPSILIFEPYRPHYNPSKKQPIINNPTTTTQMLSCLQVFIQS